MAQGVIIGIGIPKSGELHWFSGYSFQGSGFRVYCVRRSLTMVSTLVILASALDSSHDSDDDPEYGITMICFFPLLTAATNIPCSLSFAIPLQSIAELCKLFA